MNFEWDEHKRDLNIIKHSLDFVFAQYVFYDQDRLDIVDDRTDYGEERRYTIGKIGDNVLFVVYTMRGEDIRIISFRPAKKKERNKYYGYC